MLEIRFLGQFGVKVGDEALQIPTHPAKLLFIYLVLHPNTPIRRDKLAGLFWPDSTDSQARSHLRHALWRARKELEEAGIYVIQADDETIWFDSNEVCWVDVSELEKDLSPTTDAPTQMGMLEVYKGELLPGFYEEWIIRERDRIQTIFETKMWLLLERLLAQGEWAEVLNWGERWVALGELPEPAYRSLMIAYANLDDLPGAATVYQRLVTMLRQELGIEPSQATKDLYESILEGEKPIPVALITTQKESEPPAPGEPPYKGMQFFHLTDAKIFFGREALTKKLIKRLALILEDEANNPRFLAVVGASGSGKSSLLRAGLIRALRHGKVMHNGEPIPPGLRECPMVVIEPGAHPLEALALALTREKLPITAAVSLLDDLRFDPRILHLFVCDQLGMGSVSRAVGEEHVRYLLVIDQFEELFTMCRDRVERGQFVDNLVTAASVDGPVVVIIALRADFYAHCSNYPALREALERQQVYIGPMSRDELERAISEPAIKGGWTFEPGFVDFLLEEVGKEPGALPLLSHVLLETWQRRKGRSLTYTGYNQSGGICGAIAGTADRVLESFDQHGREVARNIFTRLTELGEGHPDTRRRVKPEELMGDSGEMADVQAVLEELAKARLVTLSQDTVEVAHEVLIREWPTLRDWLDQDRESLKIHRHLTLSAQAWDKMDRDAGELYRGARLVQAEEWATEHGESINPLERAFLEASIEFQCRKEVQRETRRQRELEAARNLAVAQKQRAEEEKLHAREQAQLSKRLRLLAAWLGILLMVAVSLGLLTVRQTNLAIRQSRVATARELAAAAINNLEVDPELSILLALEALDITLEEDGYVLKEAEEALHQAVSASRLRLTIQYEDPDNLMFVDYSADGTRLVTWELYEWGKMVRAIYTAYVGKRPDTRIRDVVTGEVILTVPGYRGATSWPDGNQLTTFLVWELYDIELMHWDPVSGEKQSSITIHSPSPPMNYFFNADLSRVAYLLKNGEIYIFDLGTGQEIVRIGDTDRDPDHAAVFSPDGNYLATGSMLGPVHIWDANSGQNIFMLLGHQGNVYDMAYSQNGEMLASASEDGTVILWDTRTGERLVTFNGHTDEVLGVDMSLDGRILATAGKDRRVIVWDLPTSILTGSANELFTLTGHQDAVRSVAISPKGETLTTASADGTIRVWDITPSGGCEGHVFTGGKPLSSGWKTSISLNQDGSLLAVAASDLTPKIWEAGSGQLVHRLIGHNDPVPSINFSPDGSYVVTRSFTPEPGFRLSRTMMRWKGYRNEIKVWEVSSGKEILSFQDTGADLSDLVFNPDGALLAVNYAFKDVSLLDFPGLLQGRLDTPNLVELTIPTQQEDMLPLGIDFSPDGGKIMTSVGVNRAGIWDAKSGERLLNLIAHESDVVSVGFNPNGEQVATASRDATARIWDSSTGQLLHTLAAHTGEVMGVVYSPDGLQLATASLDGSAKIWDANSGRELLSLYGHRGGITDLVYSPDGRYLYTAGLDGTVRVHLLEITELIDLAHQRLRRDFTLHECQRYLHMDQCPTDEE